MSAFPTASLPFYDTSVDFLAVTPSLLCSYYFVTHGLSTELFGHVPARFPTATESLLPRLDLSPPLPTSPANLVLKRPLLCLPVSIICFSGLPFTTRTHIKSLVRQHTKATQGSRAAFHRRRSSATSAGSCVTTRFYRERKLSPRVAPTTWNLYDATCTTPLARCTTQKQRIPNQGGTNDPSGNHATHSRFDQVDGLVVRQSDGRIRKDGTTGTWL